MVFIPWDCMEWQERVGKHISKTQIWELPVYKGKKDEKNPAKEPDIDWSLRVKMDVWWSGL